MSDEHETIDINSPERVTPIPSRASDEPQRGNGVLIIATAAIIVLVLAVGVAFVFLGGKGGKTTATADAVTTTSDATAAATSAPAATQPAAPAETPAATAPAAPAATAPANTAPAATTDTAATPAPASADTAATPPATAAAPAAPAATGPFKPVPVGDWLLLCPEPATSGPDCLLQQELRSSRTKRLVAVWALKRDNAGVVRGVFQLPPSIAADKGLVLDTGTGTPRLLPISNCSTQMCVVRAEFDGNTLNELIAATSVGANIVLKDTKEADGRPLVLKFSTRGLGAGVTKLMP
jgi:invasion protein IalB